MTKRVDDATAAEIARRLEALVAEIGCSVADVARAVAKWRRAS